MLLNLTPGIVWTSKAILKEAMIVKLWNPLLQKVILKKDNVSVYIDDLVPDIKV